jgi:uncharacterized membrane protein
MPYCPNCGTATDSRYCPKCGTLVEPGAAGAAPAGTPPAGAVTLAGLDDNVAGALCYLIGFITGIIFLVLEPYSKRPFVRFHAFQSILFSVGWIAFSMILSIGFLFFGFLHLGVVYLMFRGLIGLVGFLIWLYCMWKAFNREWYQLPIVGPIAAKQAGGQ